MRLMIVQFYVGEDEGKESFLNHLGERCVISEVAKVVNVKVFVAISSLKFLSQGKIALFHCVHVNLHRMVTIHNWVFRHYQNGEKVKVL